MEGDVSKRGYGRRDGERDEAVGTECLNTNSSKAIRQSEGSDLIVLEGRRTNGGDTVRQHHAGQLSVGERGSANPNDGVAIRVVSRNDHGLIGCIGVPGDGVSAGGCVETKSKIRNRTDVRLADVE